MQRELAVLGKHRPLAGLGRAVVIALDGGLATADDAAGNTVVLRLPVDRAGRLHDVMVADIHAWPIRSSYLDLVILRHVLAVSSRPRMVLQEAARCLVPGGRLLVTGIQPCNMWHVWLGRQQGDRMESYKPVRPGVVERMLREAGLQVETRVRYGSARPASAARTASAGPLSACFLVQARRHGNNVMRLRQPRHLKVVAGSPYAAARSLGGRNHVSEAQPF